MPKDSIRKERKIDERFFYSTFDCRLTSDKLFLLLEKRKIDEVERMDLDIGNWLDYRVYKIDGKSKGV